MLGPSFPFEYPHPKGCSIQFALPLFGLALRGGREEARGYSADIGDVGWPLDPRHPANQHEGQAKAQAKT
jgi:hypothetical protein